MTDQVPGESTLHVRYDPEARTFRFFFLSPDRYLELPSRPVEGDLRQQLVEQLIPRLDAFARNDGGLSPKAAAERMKDEGFQLWDRIVPVEIQTEILRHLDTISQMTVISDQELVPWELLYPDDDSGRFLVEHFPLVRWVLNCPKARTLSLDRPTFVVPDGSPGLAFDEVTAVSEILGTRDRHVTLHQRESLLGELGEPHFDCLHFACHNEYDASGSYIEFDDGRFELVDMARRADRRILAANHPFVFLNACRSAGGAPVYTSVESWADKFLHAGAAAVVGSSWAVRDSTAKKFAEALYGSLRNRNSLGVAVKEARMKAQEETGDSTWLAYSIFGDPSAKVSK